MKQPARDKACSRGQGGPPATTRILTHCQMFAVFLNLAISFFNGQHACIWTSLSHVVVA